MAFLAVLDTNVLLPAPLRDTLLRLAEADLYVPKWSERILAELAKNLVESGRTDSERAARVTATMKEAFPEAMAPDSLVSTIEPAMTNDPKDRHVLAAAVGVGAQVVLTHNLEDFLPEACDPLGIEALSPDDFLIDLYHLESNTARSAAAGPHPTRSTRLHCQGRSRLCGINSRQPSVGSGTQAIAAPTFAPNRDRDGGHPEPSAR